MLPLMTRRRSPPAPTGSEACDPDSHALREVVVLRAKLVAMQDELTTCQEAHERNLRALCAIAGGIAPHLLPLADRAAIRSAFAGKPPMEDLAGRFALHVIGVTDAAEQGLTAIAANLRRFGLDDPKRLWFG